MKTLTKILLTAVLGSAAAAYAGPGLQFWSRSAAKSVPTNSQPTAPTSDTPAPVDHAGLLCKTMLVPNSGFSKGPQYHSVVCTPEMMKNDWRCQQACARANRG